MAESGRVIAYVALGSNLDDPLRQVQQAFAELDAIEGTRCLARSSLYRSAPMGPITQPDYINAVAALETAQPLHDLFAALQRIEQRHGRQRRGPRWGPRTLDLDILLFGTAVVRTHELTVPHPGIAVRSFVLYPLLEVAPQLVIPGLGSVRELAAACPEGGLQRLPGSEVE